MSQLDLKLIIALARTNNKIFTNTEREITKCGLNMSEFGVLEFLYHKGPQPVQQIAAKILVTSGTITYVIDKLLKKGYVIRKRCDKDKRIYYVSLTDTGTELMAEVFPKHENYVENLFLDLDDETKQSLIDNLILLQQCMESSESTN